MRLIAIGVAMCAAVACKSTSQATAPVAVVTLDVTGFEPPFEPVPVSREFVRARGVVKVIDHERTSTRTDYDASGLPVAVWTQDAGSAWAQSDQIAYQLDASGRVLRRTTTAGDEAVVETFEYTDTRLLRIARTSHGTAQEELRSYNNIGRLVKRTRGDVGQPPFETLTFDYDATGRMSTWSGSKPGYPHDRYTFAYDARGQLAKLAFVESGKPIFDRTYTYDDQGFLVRVDQHASVPAMGDETHRYEYQLADGTTR